MFDSPGGVTWESSKQCCWVPPHSLGCNQPSEGPRWFLMCCQRWKPPLRPFGDISSQVLLVGWRVVWKTQPIPSAQILSKYRDSVKTLIQDSLVKNCWTDSMCWRIMVQCGFPRLVCVTDHDLKLTLTCYWIIKYLHFKCYIITLSSKFSML